MGSDGEADGEREPPRIWSKLRFLDSGLCGLSGGDDSLVVKGVRVGARLADEDDDMVTALRSDDGVAEDKSGSARTEFGSCASGDDLVMSATASRASQCLCTGRALDYGAGCEGEGGG